MTKEIRLLVSIFVDDRVPNEKVRNRVLLLLARDGGLDAIDPEFEVSVKELTQLEKE